MSDDEADTKPHIVLSDYVLKGIGFAQDHSDGARVYTHCEGVLVVGPKGTVVVSRGPMPEGSSGVKFLEWEYGFLKRVDEATKAVR